MNSLSFFGALFAVHLAFAGPPVHTQEVFSKCSEALGASFTPEELRALRDYVSVPNVNRYLQKKASDDLPAKPGRTRREVFKQMEKDAVLIDRAIQRSAGLDSTQDVYRVDDLDELSEIPTFLGTYIDRETAVSIAKRISKARPPVIRIIKLEKGTKGLFIPSVVPQGNNLGESEFLLPRNLRLKETDKTDEGGIVFRKFIVVK